MMVWDYSSDHVASCLNARGRTRARESSSLKEGPEFGFAGRSYPIDTMAAKIALVTGGGRGIGQAFVG
jgi:hypothetical protein